MSSSAVITRSLNIVLILFNSVILGVYSQALNANWEYGSSSNGPANWNGTCRTGVLQSPINIDPANTTRVKAGKTSMIFSSEFYNLNAYNMVNTGLYIAIVQPSTNGNPNIRIKGSGWNATYSFQAVTLHWPTEHLIKGRRFALEMCIIWKSPEGTSQEAFLRILFALSKTDNKALQPIISQLSHIPKAGNSYALPNGGLNISTFLPNVWDVFRYMGSLSQPPCTDNVMQSVFTQRMPISQAQANALQTILNNQGSPMTMSSRGQIQPTYTSQRKRIYWMPINRNKMIRGIF